MRHISQETLGRIAGVSITDVASALGLEWTSRYGGPALCRCFVHDDRHPSMRLYTKDNHYHCYACGAHGDNIRMVMEATHRSWPEACQWLMDRFGIWQPDEPRPTFRPRSRKLQVVQRQPAVRTDYLATDLPRRLQGTDNDLCTALVQTGILSAEETRLAAERFLLGSSPEHSVIYWQIDDEGRVHEGKVMAYGADCHRSRSRHPYSMSWYLKRQGQLSADWCYGHCLFGLHQLQGLRAAGCRSWSPSAPAMPTVAIVESEKTAVICSAKTLNGQRPVISFGGEVSHSSEVSPARVLWMATGGLSMLSARALAPLRGCRVILFPDTDAEGSTYRLWCERASEASRALGQPLMVSDLLERRASATQKARKIDIADYIVEDFFRAKKLFSPRCTRYMG